MWTAVAMIVAGSMRRGPHTAPGSYAAGPCRAQPAPDTPQAGAALSRYRSVPCAGVPTAGDFCRRFGTDDVGKLMDAINESRLRVWQEQGPTFFAERARIDADGSFVTTTGECKEGMALSYKNGWGYHPLLVSLANTAEPS